MKILFEKLSLPLKVREMCDGRAKWVQDAKAPLNVTVTKKHAQQGSRSNPLACAVALGCRAKGATEAFIGKSIGYVLFGNTLTRYSVMGKEREAVVAYDHGAPFAPGDYRLSPIPPSQTHRLQSKHDRTPTGKQPGINRARAGVSAKDGGGVKGKKKQTRRGRDENSPVRTF